VRSAAVPLSGLTASHPCLWGEINQTHDASWVLESNSYLLPTRSTGADGSRWWDARKQGGVNAHGEPISALTDLRGERHIYPLKKEHLESLRLPTDKASRPTVLYGGTLFDNFGHLLLDLTRTYQLLRLFRHSREPFWFHYPSEPYYKEKIPNPAANTDSSIPDHPLIPDPTIREWLHCLGILDRTRLVKKTLKCSMLASSSVLYRDRVFVSADFPVCAQAALAPKLRERLLKVEPSPGRIAYFSRHKLEQGTTRFAGEQEVVEALSGLANVDIICPEELSIKAKLKLFREYSLIAGFPQAGLILKYFVPYQRASEIARLFIFTAGQRSLNSNWVNLDRAYGFDDQVLDCTPTDQAIGDASMTNGGQTTQFSFQRSNRFDVGLVIDTMRSMASQ
jgi:hypothetical protein